MKNKSCSLITPFRNPAQESVTVASWKWEHTFLNLFFKWMWEEDSSRVNINPSQPICPPVSNYRAVCHQNQSFLLGLWVGKLEQEMGICEGSSCVTHPSVLLLSCSVSTSLAGRASPDWELLCWLNWCYAPWPLSGRNKSRGCSCCVRHTSFARQHDREVDLLAFSSLSSTCHQEQPPRNHQDYLQGKVLVRQGTFSPTWSSAAPFLGNYYKQSSSPGQSGGGWFSTTLCDP